MNLTIFNLVVLEKKIFPNEHGLNLFNLSSRDPGQEAFTLINFPIKNKAKISNNMIPNEKRKERGICSYLINTLFFKWTPIFFSIIENKNHGNCQQNCKVGTFVNSSEFPIK